MARRAKRNNVRPQATKARKHETLEDRVVMSADPLGGPMMSTHGFVDIDEVPALTHHRSVETTVETAPVYDPYADFWRSTGEVFEPELDDIGRRIEQTLAQAHDLTGQDHVLSKYGFDGAGQTVAVLDTGIAYSHYALGGGLGSGYRVVGGYDFTENDSDFYDDGPNGGHGTHVAGIIGADGDGSHSGVATGVDLVGLRVFDDAGNGYFSWVESALNWVYDNRNAFNNPITAINLSLGTDWNSDSIPSWAMLEDEFARLESVGIFIAVSAGNSYQDFNQNGVSYPAASDHVIPVMATYNSGSLANFSQRAEYAIAAPGVGITSTVPDYAANDGDTIDDDWLGMSGTSMAAPYVAGASVLIREAMEFVGQTGVDQWDIYNHMMSTADSFFDNASQTTFRRLNLEAAIDALMPMDDYGSTVAMAHGLGTLSEGTAPALNGVISTLDDSDHFSFTAGVTGTVTISASNVTHSLTTQWEAWGGTWQIDEAGNCVIDVVAGQTYSFALSTTDGLGYYGLAIDVESAAIPAIDWGAGTTQETRSGLSVAGGQDYTLVAARGGYFTAELLTQQGSATVAIYDAQGNQLAGAGARSEVVVNAGDTLTFRVAGDSSEFSLRLTNALSVVDGVATLVGTNGVDIFAFSAGATSNTLSLNGVGYSIATADASAFTINASGASDVVSLTGSSGNETASLGNDATTLQGNGYTVTANAAGSVTVNGGGGQDVATLTGTDGDDLISAWSDRVRMDHAGGVVIEALGFASVTAHAGLGTDRATLYDTAGNETLRAWSDRVVIEGDGFSNEVRGFDQVTTFASGGVDRAHMYGTAGNEVFTAWANRAVVNGAGFFNDARGFDQVTAYAGEGTDRAYLYGTASAETFTAWSDRTVLSGTGFFNDARQFEQVIAYGSGGVDRAHFHDTAGNDVFSAWSDRVVLSGDGFFNDARGFVQATAYATGGYDRAYLNDTAGNETFSSWSDRGVLIGDGFFNDARGFDRVVATATGGTDRAFLRDSTGDDTFSAWSDRTRLVGAGYLNEANGFDQVTAYASGGHDKAFLYDTAGNEVYTAWATRSVMNGDGFFNDTRDFEHVIAYGTTGFDRAYLHDSAGNDVYTSWSDRAVLAGSGFFNDARGFDQMRGYATGGFDRAYTHGTTGDDEIRAAAWGVALTSPEALSEAHAFESVTAYSQSSGNDTATVEDALDYAFALDGTWT